LIYSIGNCPNGAESKVLCDILNQDHGNLILYLAENEGKALKLRDLISFFDPNIKTLYFPDWRSLPYDSVALKKHLVAQRVKFLFDLFGLLKTDQRISKTIIITTVKSAIQKIPPKEFLKKNFLKIFSNQKIKQELLVNFLTANGYSRTSLVQEYGDFSLRGDIIDVFSSASKSPVRIDFFDNKVESIRIFDPANQRTIKSKEKILLLPMSEFILDMNSIKLFREKYRNLFGTSAGKDQLYETVSSNMHYEGLEYWSPLFHHNMSDLFQLLLETRKQKIKIAFQKNTEDKINKTFDLIGELYSARLNDQNSKKILPPNYLYLNKTEWDDSMRTFENIQFSPFKIIDKEGNYHNLKNFKHTTSHFQKDRLRNVISVFKKSKNKKLIVAFDNKSSQKKLGNNFLKNYSKIKSWNDLDNQKFFSAVLDLDNGFTVDNVTFISETEAFGMKKKIAQNKEHRDPKDIISEITSLSVGNLVVHKDHGIGRYDGLRSLRINHALHDYLQVTYAREDKLFVPVENIDILSRFGHGVISELDTLGSAAWQKRKSKTRGFIKNLANDLIKTEARRKINKASPLESSESEYAKFSSNFPYIETKDQEIAINKVIQGISKTIPMDRLVCGDVGFGKTEIALRASFIAVSSGMQVAIIVPTTILAIQHYETFKKRFEKFKVNIAQLSRLIPKKKLGLIKKDLVRGNIDIAIGTHTLLSKDIFFNNLGLLIIDEEQHFGVRHKEKIKNLKSNIHILTLTATPIPRTLQLALVGVREMSLIATPPSNRMGIDTFIIPYDTTIVRRAITTEIKRGGQVFFVCPRIQDILNMHDQLNKMVPEAKITIAHGKMPSRDLDKAMLDFYQGNTNLLLSTTIIESGLDIPNTNTIIIYRADLFGLAQLHQLRGRVGRSSIKAYAYLTYPEKSDLPTTAKQRLEVISKLDSLGVGFSLASYDLDIRGAGNLLGEEQSGHMREVGVELYQEMLKDTIHELKGKVLEKNKKTWLPKIFLGEPVYIPESYIGDLNIRLSLYKKISLINNDTEMRQFIVELKDRFGPVPNEVKNLADVISIKRLCLDANVVKLELGSKGVQIFLRNERFPNPEGLIDFIKRSKNNLRLKSNNSFIFKKAWSSYKEKIMDIKILLNKIFKIAKKAG